MGKRHQASRRKAYGRRQHEMRERFDRAFRDDHTVAIRVYDIDGYDDVPEPRQPFDFSIVGGVRFVAAD